MSENSQRDEQAQYERQEYDNRQGQKSGQGRNGRYSPNQCFFFVVLTLLILIPFLGQRLAHPVQNIKRASLKNIYSALTAPIVSVTESSPVAAVIPVLRNVFIRTAGLAERGEWDTFFYRQGVYDSEVAAFYAVTGRKNLNLFLPIKKMGNVLMRLLFS